MRLVMCGNGIRDTTTPLFSYICVSVMVVENFTNYMARFENISCVAYFQNLRRYRILLCYAQHLHITVLNAWKIWTILELRVIKSISKAHRESNSEQTIMIKDPPVKNSVRILYLETEVYLKNENHFQILTDGRSIRSVFQRFNCTHSLWIIHAIKSNVSATVSN